MEVWVTYSVHLFYGVVKCLVKFLICLFSFSLALRVPMS